MSQQRRDWDEIGRLDALWAILSDPAKRHGRWGVDEFLATGRREIDTMLETARCWNLPKGGVGRLTRALAALQRVSSVCDGLLLVETETALNFLPFPAARVWPGRELKDDDTNWWSMNRAALLACSGSSASGTCTSPTRPFCCAGSGGR